MGNDFESGQGRVRRLSPAPSWWLSMGCAKLLTC